METQTLSTDLRQYISLLWHWAWLIILAAILSSVSAYVVSQQMTPVYQTTSTLFVNAPGSKAADYSAIISNQNLTKTYAEMLVKKPVLEEVITRLNLQITVTDLKEMVSVQPVRDTQLIDIVVEDISPARTAAIANEIGIVFSEQNQALQESRYASTKESLQVQLDDIQLQIDELYKALSVLDDSLDDQEERYQLEATLSQYRQTYASTLQSYEQVRLAEAETISTVVNAETADPPEDPIRPRVLMNTALAGVVGIMLAVGTIFLIEALDDTIRGADDVPQHLELPVLGVIRKTDQEEGFVTAVMPRSPVSEDFRSLRTNIQFASVDSPLNTILITSPTPGNGKSTVAANLSVILAQGEKSVSLIDADLRRPRLHRRLKLSNRTGLTSLFTSNEYHLDDVLRKSDTLGISFMTSGQLPPNPAELLGSEKMLQILTEVKTQSDIIIIDSPPLTAVTDAAVLSKRVDGVLLVIEPGKTKIVAAKMAVNQLKQVGANILGVVLNKVGPNGFRYSNYDYYVDEDASDGNDRSKENKSFLGLRIRRPRNK